MKAVKPLMEIITTIDDPEGTISALEMIPAPNSSLTPFLDHKSSSRNLYANLKSALRRFILVWPVN